MNALHTLNKSLSAPCVVRRCLSAAAEHDGLLLVEDGVYALLNKGGMLDEVFSVFSESKVFCLREDAEARGIADKVSDHIQFVDYAGFVALTARSKKVISWF